MTDKEQPKPIETWDGYQLSHIDDYHRGDYDAETKSQRNRRRIAIVLLLLTAAGIVGYLIANP